MHLADPIHLPDIETGLHVVRWHASGFQQMRRAQLLDPKGGFELVDGLVLHRSDRSRQHDRVTAELARRLSDAEFATGTRVEIDRELSFEDLDAVVTPDITVSRRGEVPELVVEVSDHAPRLDGMEKARLYARAGVDVYWHIDIAWTMFQVHTSPHDDGYGMRAGGPPWESSHTWFSAFPDLNLLELLEASGCAPRTDRRALDVRGSEASA